MVTKYIPRKRKKQTTQLLMILLKKDYPVCAQIKDVAEALKNACPEIFKKDDPYPTVRMDKFKEGEVVYEITEGKGSRAKVGCI